MNAATCSLVLLASALFFGCEPGLEPDYVTPAGMQVYSEEDALSFEGAELDAIVVETLEVFAEEWRLTADPSALPLPVLSVLGEDSYRFAGQLVAGNLSSDGKWIYIGAKTRPLHDTAFVHELIHYFDLVAHGTTDETHASWKGSINDKLTRINTRIAKGELRGKRRGG